MYGNKLIEIFETHSPYSEDKFKSIGKQIDTVGNNIGFGGSDLMILVATYVEPTLGNNFIHDLEWYWNGIGEWQR